MIRRPPSATLLPHPFPTRRSSDLDSATGAAGPYRRAARACDDSRLRRHRPFRSAPEIDDEAALRRPVGQDKGSSTMISASIGLILGCLIGAGCRSFDLPLPAPPRLVGALLVVPRPLGVLGAAIPFPHSRPLPGRATFFS